MTNLKVYRTETEPFRRDRSDPLRVVVLTCDGLGFETAAALHGEPGVDVVAVVNSPHPRLTLRRKLRKIRRSHGVWGLVRLLLTRLFASDGRQRSRSVPQCRVIAVSDFHDAETLATIRELDAHLGIVDGTYILKPMVFNIPAFGCINIHCGRVPEYRGSPPAFWELYDGTPIVGVTIHAVTERVDEGPVLLQRDFAFDVAPEGDPMRYIRQYWRDVLRPNALQLICAAVAGVRDGSLRPEAQRQLEARTRRTPTVGDVRELRRRVRRRRAGVAT